MILFVIFILVVFPLNQCLYTDPRTIYTLRWNSSSWDFDVFSDSFSVSFMSSGRESTVIVTNDEKLYGFGRNRFGELGLGHRNDVNSSFEFIMGGVSRVCMMSYTTLILTNGGEILTAGRNVNGELGRDSTDPSFSSQFDRVMDPNLVLRGKGITTNVECDLSSGYVVKDGDPTHLYSWGNNSIIYSPYPVPLGIECYSRSLSCDRYLCTVQKSEFSVNDYYAWGESYVLINDRSVNVDYVLPDLSISNYDAYLLSSLRRQAVEELEITDYVYNRNFSVFLDHNGTLYIAGYFDYGVQQHDNYKNSTSDSSVFSLELSPHTIIGQFGVMDDTIVVSSAYSCYGVYGMNPDVCFGNGICINNDKCECYEAGSGPRCVLECFGVLGSDYDNVCGGHGNCIGYDICACTGDYLASTKFGICDSWFCGDYMSQDEKVCNKRGSCVVAESCDCLYRYEGNLCQFWSCEFPSTDPNSCSGHGQCVGPEMCKCKLGYRGKLCRENTLVRSIGSPIITFSTITLGVIICLCFLCNLTIVCCVICIFLAICCSLATLVSVVSVQKLRMKKFGKLKNIDLLITEQEMEKDTSIAHIRISRDLFKIEYDEIKVERILGEGGSNATVYLANWKGQTVAFKCFKTRFICSDQDSFNEFEREVEILASVKHPHVIAFYGATMNPPRVGIIMEYCENGDLCCFLKKFREENGEKYPFEQKMRLLHEVIMALDYLHGRDVIHRDLKLENILIKEDETSRLMDFGLSKMVSKKNKFQTKMIGTSFYMAPEIVHKDGSYDEKCDVFSFGILSWMILTEEEDPYDGLTGMIEMKVANDPSLRPSLEKMEKMIPTRGGESKCSNQYSMIRNEQKLHRWLVHAIVRSWDHESTNRPSFEELHEIFSEKWVNRNQKEEGEEKEEYLANQRILNEIMESKKKKVGFEKVVMGKEYLEIQQRNEELGRQTEELEKQLLLADKTFEELSSTARNDDNDNDNDDNDDLFEGVNYVELSQSLKVRIVELESEIEELQEGMDEHGRDDFEEDVGRREGNEEGKREVLFKKKIEKPKKKFVYSVQTD